MNKNLLYFYAGRRFRGNVDRYENYLLTGEHCNRRIVILLTLLRYYKIVEINELKISTLLFPQLYCHSLSQTILVMQIHLEF